MFRKTEFHTFFVYKQLHQRIARLHHQGLPQCKWSTRSWICANLLSLKRQQNSIHRHHCFTMCCVPSTGGVQCCSHSAYFPQWHFQSISTQPCFQATVNHCPLTLLPTYLKVYVPIPKQTQNQEVFIPAELNSQTLWNYSSTFSPSSSLKPQSKRPFIL